MNRKTKRLKWTVGVSIIACTVIALSFVTLQGNSVFFYTPSEAIEKAATLQKSEMRVGGMVEANSMKWDRKTLDLQFVLSDMKGKTMNVAYKGTPPDLFKENSGVVVEGNIDIEGKNFLATKLMVKHSEEYRKPDGSFSMDRELLEKSLFKDENG